MPAISHLGVGRKRMKNLITLGLLVVSAFVHVFVYSARVIDPVIWTKEPTAEEIERANSKEERNDSRGWTREQSIIEAASNSEGIKGKGWIETPEVTVGHLESTSFTSTYEMNYKARFGLFESLLLASFMFHSLTIIYLRIRRSNKAELTTPDAARPSS